MCPCGRTAKGHKVREEVTPNGTQWVSDCQACGTVRNACALVMSAYDMDLPEAKQFVCEVGA